MASLQASWFSSLSNISPTNVKKSHSVKPFKVSFSLNSSNGEISQPNSPNSPDTSSEAEPGPVDPVKLAFAKAKEYKKSVKESPKLRTEQNPVEDSVKVALENDKESKRNKGMVSNDMNGGESDRISSGLKEKSGGNSGTGTVEKKDVKLSVSSIDFMGLNFADKKKGRGLPPGLVPVSDPFPEGDISEVQIIVGDTSKFGNGKESSSESVSNSSSGKAKEVPDSVKIAMEKAKEYRKNKGVVDTDSGISRGESGKISGLKETTEGKLDTGTVEKKADKKGEFSISSVDFMGLNFADKKIGRGLPPGLVPVSDPFPEGDIPEVEIIVGDTGKFQDAKSLKPDQPQESDSDVYKPKVSTWGVFPRPSNISKTFGGGRVINPGQALETADEKAAKEARTRKLIADYKKKVGMNIDPKLKSACKEALKEGDSLMNLGKLNEALPYYQKVMDKLPFQSELHGLAALQWSICQDSLRSDC
ncbi:uncharacterized protein LOC21391965 [Morus notabilis]|uniref:uncharacterized protein LOC21391965 n=1 Tax=Morus notabilis TaxID=981085 RepID=UPI000CED5AB9|nr:uncharacterized protein LOC21391965 [Morus notabilis]